MYLAASFELPLANGSDEGEETTRLLFPVVCFPSILSIRQHAIFLPSKANIHKLLCVEAQDWLDSIV